ncbi:hypothetical protein TNCV_4276291 [Trichonephila clavipes]|nr:hypothetical protein TNCV_4276291 [Trichonephila clavipes]
MYATQQKKRLSTPVLDAPSFEIFKIVTMTTGDKIVTMVPTKPQKAFCAFCSLGPPHFLNDVKRYLNEHFPQPWIGRTGRDDKALLKWSPRSPDLTPCDFSFVGLYQRQSLHPTITSSLDGDARADQK